MQNPLVYCHFLAHTCIAGFERTCSNPLLPLNLVHMCLTRSLFILKKKSTPVVQKNVTNSGQTPLQQSDRSSKKLFVSLQMLISFNPCGQTYQMFYHTLLYNFITRSYGQSFRKNILYHFMLNALKTAVLECFEGKLPWTFRG